jgi:predicted nucleic acid-binding protein
VILLDTNVCIRILRGRKDAVKAFSENAGDVAVPFMVLGELYYGAAHSDDPVSGKTLVDRFARALPVVDSSPAIMARFGVEKARLAAAGTPIEDADVLIAATALECGGMLATGNVRHFKRFTDLEILVW